MNKQVAKIEAEAEVVTGIALLRQPFPAHQISKLPKESKKQAEERKAGQNSINNCPICGGWHHKNAVHLDYVGHAALTDRLLDADPEWTWEPMAFAPDGAPSLAGGGMWIKLTVCGVTRIGYGSADGKTGGDAVKEIIGDALRNAAMRFGAALDLWHKGDLHAPEAEAEAEAEPDEDPETAAAVVTAKAAMDLAKTEDALTGWGKSNGPMIQGLPAPQAQAIRRYYTKRQDILRKTANPADMPSDDEIPY